ncbi:MAG: hypothetical protein CR217_05720 [Beijerinckiaceae bacterium]|nr:MAG: hypothetical protein CR217_05720 [Beijerinckiaceae bacterium]
MALINPKRPRAGRGTGQAYGRNPSGRPGLREIDKRGATTWPISDFCLPSAHPEPAMKARSTAVY